MNEMIDFIRILEQKFDIRLQQLNDFDSNLNSFELDQQGSVIGLNLRYVNLKNLDFLLPIAHNLQELSLENCSIERLDSLIQFKNLQILNLSNNKLTRSCVEKLQFAENLQKLDLRLTNISQTSSLGNLTKLKVLNLGYNSKLREVRGLEKLELLSKIEIPYNEISSIEKLFINDKIESINLSAGALKRISGLERFKNLSELNLSSNSIPKIVGLNGLIHLRRLKISTTWIKKIEGLDDLINLEILDLSNQSIEKIEGLTSLLNLKQLNLSENRISKVENLGKLTQLSYVLLECNEIEEFETNFLSKLTSPCHISLVGNPIKKLNESIPENVTVQFEDEHWTPKGL